MYAVHIHVIEGVAGVTGSLYVTEQVAQDGLEATQSIKVSVPNVAPGDNLEEFIEDIASELYNVASVFHATQRGLLEVPALW